MRIIKRLRRIQHRFLWRVFSRLALLSFLGCEGTARVDYFLTDDGLLYFNEINTFPGFTEISLYPRLMERAGIPPKELLTKLTEAALDRRV